MQASSLTAQAIKIEGQATAHLIEWPSLSSTFRVELGEPTTVKLFWLNGNVLYEGEYQGGGPEGKGNVYLEDGSIWYEGTFAHGTLDSQGTLYRPNGDVLYQGNFSAGLGNTLNRKSLKIAPSRRSTRPKDIRGNKRDVRLRSESWR